MPLETATYISDLVNSNPPTSDLETQGANHLQLIKSVLQNVFGTTSRRFVGLPTIATKSANYSIVAADAGTTFQVQTGGGAVTLTLPSTLGAADAGWEISVFKISFGTTNPVFIQPASGTMISGEYSNLTSIRRSIPGRRTRIFWTGNLFIAERVESRPIGTIFDSSLNTLPNGYEWANGQTLSSAANYPEYFAVFGNGLTVDMKGRASFGLDNPGGTGTSGRITVAGGNFDGTVGALAGGVGGLQNHTQTVNEMPVHQHANTVGETAHSHAPPGGAHWEAIASNAAGFTTSNPGGAIDGGTANTQTALAGVTITNVNAGGGAAFTVLPPAAVLAKIVVVE